MTERLKQEIAHIASLTEENLTNLISKYRADSLYTSELSRVIDAAEYSLLAGGKRLRPFLVHSFCSLCGGNDALALAPAAAIEMVHTYSLIHDDLPCMDNDDFRRGKPTNHKVFGEATAVLAGDGLLTEAFSVISTSPLSDNTKVELIKVLASCAGILGMVGGQEIDLSSEGKLISHETLLKLQSKKTGMLFDAAARMGCIASGNCNDVKLHAASVFSRSFGLAFQITDDILDVVGTSDVLGKSIGSDERDSKYTFVTHLGIDGARDEALRQISIAKEALSAAFDCDSTGVLLDLCDYLITRES